MQSFFVTMVEFSAEKTIGSVARRCGLEYC